MLMGGLIWAEKGRSYELHGEQVAVELSAAAELDGEGFWWTIGSSGANCGVSAGGAAVEARFDGGLELAGVQVDGGGALVAIGRRSRA